MQIRFFCSLLIINLLLFTGCAAKSSDENKYDSATIAFGACLRQWKPKPVLGSISILEPDVFIFLGDNVYSDIGKYKQMEEPYRIRKAYEELSSSTDFQKFIASAENNSTAIYAIWDDHDYGKNDSGSDYIHKQDSKEYFMEFFNIEKTVTPADEPGVYRSEHIELIGLNIQLLLLDTRSFRSPLVLQDFTSRCPRRNTGINIDKDATVLGDEQWKWLEEELQKPADIRIIASSIQLIPTEHCWEKWANFPNERKRLFDLLKSTKANGVIVVSGDRHLGEISVLPPKFLGYPLYEITSSGLNSALGVNSVAKEELNSFRISEENILVDNFGSIQILKSGEGVELMLQIRDENGNKLQEKVVELDSLKNLTNILKVIAENYKS